MLSRACRRQRVGVKSNENIGAVDLSEELPAVVATWEIVPWHKIAGSAFRVSR